MTRTFSKIYGLAGLRIGWAYCPAGGGRRAEPHPRPVQRVGARASRPASRRMDDTAHVEAAVAHNEQWLPWLTTEIEKLGLRVTPSVGNFMLVHFPADARQATPRRPMRS